MYKTKTNMKHSGVGNEVLVSKAKNIRTLENRLEKSLTKYNETVRHKRSRDAFN